MRRVCAIGAAVALAAGLTVGCGAQHAAHHPVTHVVAAQVQAQTQELHRIFPTVAPATTPAGKAQRAFVALALTAVPASKVAQAQPKQKTTTKTQQKAQPKTKTKTKAQPKAQPKTKTTTTAQKQTWPAPVLLPGVTVSGSGYSANGRLMAEEAGSFDLGLLRCDRAVLADALWAPQVVNLFQKDCTDMPQLTSSSATVTYDANRTDLLASPVVYFDIKMTALSGGIRYASSDVIGVIPTVNHGPYIASYRFGILAATGGSNATP